MPEYTHLLNGQLLAESRLWISPRDLGFVRGYGVLDSLVTYQGKPFYVNRHIDRLFESASIIRLPIPWPRAQLVNWIDLVLSVNNDRHEKLLKLMITGGIGPDSLTPSTESPTIVILCDRCPDYSEELYRSGIAVITKEHERFTPKAKSISYLAGVMCLQEAREQGAREVIFYSGGQVMEGVTSNVFAVIDGTLCTPAANVLDGVTRHILLQLTKGTDSVAVKDISLDAFTSAEEIFICSSSRGVIPVTVVDQKPVGNGTVGPKTKEMMGLFNEYVASGEWQEAEL